LWDDDHRTTANPDLPCIFSSQADAGHLAVYCLRNQPLFRHLLHPCRNTTIKSDLSYLNSTPNCVQRYGIGRQNPDEKRSDASANLKSSSDDPLFDDKHGKAGRKYDGRGQLQASVMLPSQMFVFQSHEYAVCRQFPTVYSP
jgi:hypothetical protein